ncbi:hypothetical protein [uncultured Helicobacter sp.]|uniref:hypothetical protein n=1 Tax=uncultured Helicobacter sp. TaxID=175537 RepID=UPI00375091B2
MSVCAAALHISFDFCVAKMAESIGIDSARLVLPHALLFESGKALIRFFEVVDSVSCLESSSVYRKDVNPRGVPDALTATESHLKIACVFA